MCSQAETISCLICGKPILHSQPCVVVTCDCGDEKHMHQLCSDADDIMVEQHMLDNGLLPRPVIQ